MYHNHITVLRGGKWCQVLSGESNLCTRGFFSALKIEKWCFHLDFSSLEMMYYAESPSKIGGNNGAVVFNNAIYPGIGRLA